MTKHKPDSNLIVASYDGPSGREFYMVHKPLKRAGDEKRTKPRVGAGKWMQPGGKFEPNESSSAALFREANDELGFDFSAQKGRFSCVGVLKGYFSKEAVDPMYTVEVFWINLTPAERMKAAPKCKPGELDGHGWFMQKAPPWDQMLRSDQKWVPSIFAGKLLLISVRFDGHEDKIISCEMSPLGGW